MGLNLKIAVSSLLAVVLMSGTVNAAGFSLYEWSARGTAMGGAVMANKAEPASIAANPALITKLEGTQAQVGFTLVDVSAKTTVAGQSREIEGNIFFIPNAYVTGKLNENVYVGVGLFSRFGLGEDYKNYKTWVGSLISHSALLETFSVNPNIAVKINEELSLAMGLEAMTLSFSEKKYADTTTLGAVGELTLEGDSISWGGNFGAYYTPSWAEKWAAALTYRTKVKHVVQGKVNTSGAFATIMSIPSGYGTAPLTFPDSVSFAVAHNPIEKLIVEANITGTFWSSFKTLRVDYNDTDLSLVEQKNYKDVFKLALGAEYSLTENWDLRAGYYYDQSPVNPKYMDTLVPAHDRNVFSIGAGYKKDNWGIDFSYSYLKAADLNGSSAHSLIPPIDSVPVSYENSSSNIVGLNFKYMF
ncbi:MAG: outer membrane protein transport protein [Endomicrobia bacterium]|nr:outer membrane protein transport protein [Endomicrobiia bacterium]